MSERKFSAQRPAGLAVLTTQGQKSFGGDGEEYSLEEVLGEGSYGSVYRCLRARDSAVFAVKIIDTLRIGFVGGAAGVKAAQIMAVREVDALRQLSSHPNVISLEAAFFSEATQQIFIVTDFVPGSHLFSHVVQRTAPLQEAEASHIVAQISDAVSFCHALGIVHRDLKLENILVSSVSMRLAEKRGAGEAVSWQTEELFSVRVCDFGFAKSLQAFTTRTPIGTGTYAAPEVKLVRDGEELRSGSGEPGKDPKTCTTGASEGQYDAFKADAFSMGVMIFVMLCLGFPSKNKTTNTHRTHKLWPSLSPAVHYLIDGLLEVVPAKRLSVIDICNNAWVSLIVEAQDEDHAAVIKRTKSKDSILAHAEEAWNSRRSPQPRWRRPQAQDAALPGVLALQRALVHIQQERAMACWALSGASGLSGISCWDQLQWHVQLTEKRLHEAKNLLSKCLLAESQGIELIDALFSNLTKARRIAQARMQPDRQLERTMSSTTSFDHVFVGYNSACGALIGFVAQALERCQPGSGGRHAARRYHLFVAAAEQLGRERAFMCGHEEQAWGLEPSPPGSPQCGSRRGRRTTPNRMHRLAEILGARKILLGTVVGDNEMAGDVVATSTGLLGTLIGEDEPPLLSTDDIAKLESLEQRVLAPTAGDEVPTEEWYQTITRFLNEIHSRIAINLVEDMRLADLELGSALGEEDLADGARSRQFIAVSAGACGCRAGLKRLLQLVVDRL